MSTTQSRLEITPKPGSAKHHFEMMRKDLNLKGKGLEIGGAFSPVCPKAAYDVKTLDVMTKDQLVEFYSKDPLVADIVSKGRTDEVDYIWSGEPYIDLVGKDQKFDYIVAANVIEHSIDLIQFLNYCSDILADDGILSLGVPDKRFSCDFFREVTSIRNVFDVHALNTAVHPLGVHVDFAFHNVFFQDEGHQIPDYAKYEKEKILFSYQKSIQFIKDMIANYDSEKFIDQHAWIFTPTSLRILVMELYALGMIDLVEHSFDSTPKGSMQFYLRLRKGTPAKESAARELDWTKLLDLLIERQKEDVSGRMDEVTIGVMCNYLTKRKCDLYVCGADSSGNRLGRLIVGQGFDFSGFVVGDDREIMANPCFDKPVLHLSEALKQGNPVHLFISLSSDSSDEILHKLNGMGFSELTQFAD